MATKGRWVLLQYHLPREPSTPRIAVWRKLKRLGAAQLSDGLVGLPRDARTQEQLEWLAEEIIEAGGTAVLWFADPGSMAAERTIASALASDRAAEYQAVTDEATAAVIVSAGEARRALQRLRRQLHRIRRRDYFPPSERDEATAAVRRLAAHLAVGEDETMRGEVTP